MIYGPNGLLAEVPGTQTGAPIYRISDHLGSASASLLADGTLVNPVDYTPFGDGYVASGADNDHYHFASLDQDTSATDHAQFRQYSNLAGRWMSPDPYDGSYGFSNPQSLNRYSYVLNNPLSLVDPSGTRPDPVGDFQAYLRELTNNGADIFYIADYVGFGSLSPVGGGPPWYPQITHIPGRAPNKKQPPPQKKPCKATTRIGGVIKAADGAVTATAMANLAALGYYGSFFIVGAACVPEPGVLVACPAGLFAGGSLAGSATVMTYGAYKVAKEEMIPGIKQAFTCTETD
jgi:RHS repeat-associated protein